jgi:UDP-N-acetylglucosamine--N-acetylmuramyl-(pentapeptide) pyrophosphoryl-undecaprenol N-acetylglucosamine transferase
LFPVKVIVSLFQSFFVIKKVRPNVVVGTGGYVCGPILYISSKLGIPTIVHESNSYPGLTTRLLAARVSKVLITFAVTKKWISPRANVELVGNPTREELSMVSRNDGSEFFNLDPKKKTLFVFGGSLGAASINKTMPQVVNDAITNDYQIIWQTGETDIQSENNGRKHPNIKEVKFVDRMDCAYAAADIIVSRSGATTLAELTRLGKPAILIPYPFAAANHQEMNAQTMVESGAAIMIKDADIQKALLPAVRELLFDDKKQSTMREKSLALGRSEAGREIAKKILSMKK